MIINCQKHMQGLSLPFKATLSFVPLINYLKSKVENSVDEDVTNLNYVLAKINNAPELLQPIVDDSIVDKYKVEIELLMKLIFPSALDETVIGAAIAPFSKTYFYTTKGYQALFCDDTCDLTFSKEFDSEKMYFNQIVLAYVIILKFCYGIDYMYESPMVYKIINKTTNLEEFYKAYAVPRFGKVIYKGVLPKLEQETINQLINRFDDMEFWLKTFPLENFDIQGIIPFNFVNVTNEQIISSLKTELLEKEAIIAPKRFTNLQQKIRNLLRLPDVMLGLFSFTGDDPNDRTQTKIWNSILLTCCEECTDYTSSLYESAVRERRTKIINNLEKHDLKSDVEKQILKQGVKSLSVTPLYYENELVGFLELGSPKGCDINYLLVRMLEEVFPIFGIAVKRALDEFATKVQATIKEECTAIHPTVEWRFIDAAENLLHKVENGEVAEMEKIVFKDVYPLYGACDIRNSSTGRNKAILEDLIEQLNPARNIAIEAYRLNALPIFDYQKTKIEHYITLLESGINAGDEMNILEFLRKEVEPNYKHLLEREPALNEVINLYTSAIDPDLGILYKRRKNFEDSMMLINDSISAFLEKEEDKAQEMFPHYFEKYKTDGVEYNIYLGSSLLEDGKFEAIYLENMRLWQLINMCEIVRKTAEVKLQLKVPLETTQLILVHSVPISIRFRLDEKRFDVDGAYNARYEIIKKRIDKSHVKGTDERVTQPNKISIIYSQSREQKEYEQYIQYLMDKKMIKKQIEYLELEELQGAHGLKALRIEVL